MVLGRGPIRQTTEPRGGFVSAIRGKDGRMPPPPANGLYVRDPQAARAAAIRDKVAQLKETGQEIPEHLQAMYDALPKDDDGCEVDLVKETTGEHIAEVETLIGETPPTRIGSTSNLFPEEAKSPPAYVVSKPPPEPEPEPQSAPDCSLGADIVDVEVEPETAASAHGGAGALSVAAEPAAPNKPLAPLPPKPRGRPRKST